MKYVEVGGVRLSAVGVGTWQFGSGEWGYGSEYATTTAPAIVQRSLDLGVNLVDTAEVYGFGRSERIVGQALAGRRDEAFVATKLLPLVPVDPVVDRRARGSARRLGIEAIDLYQLHWPNPVVPMGPTMRAMAALQAEGLVRHVGVSNFSLAQWQAAEDALGGPVLSNQVQYSLTHRAPDADLVAWAQANDRLIIAYSPLGQGLLSGRYDAEHLPHGMRAATGAFLPENLERFAPLLEVLRQVAEAHGTSCAQVALAWLVARPHVVVIPGASSVAQAEANAAAADLELADDELAALTEVSDAYRPTTGAAAFGRVLQVRAERTARRFRRAVEGMRS
jgi:aryl-alcohol dehydrogenase-like predicted oxidoreductase